MPIGASTYTFDADGNTLTGGGRTNTWDSQNRLVSCVYGGTTSTFKYGADGLRRQATVGGITTDYVYDGSTLIREGHASGGTLTAANVTATYLTGPRGPEYRRDDTAMEMDSQGRTVSKTRWYVYDGLGSVVGEIDPSGNLTSSPKYDVYGGVRSNSGTASSKMGFVGGLGHLSEANTGLIYMRARYYDPSNGRFSSEDPNRSGINWFIYCDNNPVNKLDANGKSPFLVAVAYVLACMGVSAILGALLAATFSAVEQFVATGKVNWSQVGDDAGTGAVEGAVAGLVLGIVTVVGASLALIAGAGAIAAVAFGSGFLWALLGAIIVGVVAGAIIATYFAPPDGG